MTRSKHFKALVRARMARNGEVYTAARDGLLAELDGIRLEPVATIEAHDKHCIAVRFTPDGRELLTGGFGGQARIWSTKDWSKAGELVGHTASVNGFGLDAAGGAITVSSDGSVRVWDVPTRTDRGALSTKGKVGLGVDIRFDGRLAATGPADVVRFHRLGDGAAGAAGANGGAASDGTTEPAPIKAGGRVGAVAFEPGSTRLAIASFGGGVLIVATDGSATRRLDAVPNAINARWSPDAAFLTVTGQDVVAVLETIDWTEVRRLEIGKGGMLPVATSPDGALLAIGWEHHVGVWRADDDEHGDKEEQGDEDEPAALIGGLPKGVYALDFSPDGRLLAQGGADGRVRIWRVRAG